MVWSPVGSLDCTAVAYGGRGYLCDGKVDFPVLAVKEVDFCLLDCQFYTVATLLAE